jgi:uncharacterized membrane protein
MTNLYNLTLRTAYKLQIKHTNMTKIIAWLAGKKTYILAIALFAYAIGGALTGHLSWNEALNLIFGSGIVASLRLAIDGK